MATIAAVRPLQLDPGRIAAGAGAIALNAALLLLLMVPVAAPPVADRESREVIDFIPLPARPVPPPKPIEVPVNQRPPRPQPEPRPAERPVAQPPLDTTDLPQPGDIVVPPGDERVVDVPSDPTPPVDTGRPMEGAHLEYAAAPAPTYPRDALVAGLTGTVMLQVLVDVDGRPLEVTVQRSSGHRALDVAARRQVLSRWRFRPAMRDGVAVQAIGIVPVEFRLD